MSEQNDNLKSMFDQAFQAENIPFDQNAWSQMEAMLNRRERRRAIWLWFAGLVIFSSAASWYALDVQSSAVYSPRNLAKSNFSNVESLKTTRGIKNAQPEATAPMPSVRPTEPIQANDNRIDASVAGDAADHNPVRKGIDGLGIEGSNASTISGKKGNTKNVSVELQQDQADLGMTSSSDTIPYDAPTKSVQNRTIENSSQPEILSLLPILDIPIDHTNESIQANAKPKPEIIQRAKNIYARAGISKSVMYSGGLANGIGQFGGLGLQVYLRPHLLVSGELGINRCRVYDQVSITGPKSYGYSVNENTSEIVTEEMLDLEIPLLVQYRWNRLVFGTGLSPIILLGIRNRTDQVVSNENTTVSYNSLDGYYQWNRYRRLNVHALLDAQYQLSDDAFVGTRANLGLFNRAGDGLSNASFTRFELYLKINFK
ncbi:MAG: hypothetical protein Salg2KO_15700 [Salibacteraceae bacterium]